MQLTFSSQIPERTSWRPTPVSELPSWRDAKRVALDFEGWDPHIEEMGTGVRRGDAYLCGVSFAIEDGPAYYLPFKHSHDPDNLSADAVLAYLRDQAADFRGILVGANMQHEIDWSEHHDIRWRPERFYDVQLAEPLIDGLQYQYNLDAIAGRRMLAGKDESLLRRVAAAMRLDPKRDIAHLPAWAVADYAVRDAHLPLAIARQQDRDLDEMDLHRAWAIECGVLPVAVGMRRRGVRVDIDAVDAIEAWTLQEEQRHLDEVGAASGRRLTPANTMSRTVMAEIVSECCGVQLPRTTDGKESVTSKILRAIDHPVARAIVAARELNKLRNTFCAQVRSYAIRHGDEWRVHCTFNQLRVSRGDAGDDEGGAVTGRFSSSDFNLQNQPIRSDIPVPSWVCVSIGMPPLDPKGKQWKLGAVWRHIFKADRGAKFYDADFSQQEPRIENHFAEKLGLPGAREAGDRWRANPRLDGHQLVADMTGLPRKRAKEVRLGLGYGMGGGKLCREYLKAPTKWITIEHGPRAGKVIEVAGDEGQAIIDAFNKGAPYIKLLARQAERTMLARGWIRVIGGARLSTRPGEERKAGNYLIQGSAARQTKLAMLRVAELGIEQQLQVHDSLSWSDDSDERALEAKRAMERAVELTVPSVVDLEGGESWGLMDEIAEAA